MVRRGRQPQFNHAGVRNPKAHLTEEAVRIIREDGRTALELARAFGVSRDAVYDIKHRRTWRHIP